MPEYRVQLDTYSGPMDLLLYLIRRDEVDIYDIPIARILEQFLQYVRLLERLDPEVVGDFLVLAATLMEIKSRLLLPKPPPEEDDDEGLDPRVDLVRQLLAYKAFRDAAMELGQRADQHAKRFGRPDIEVPEDDSDPDFDLEEVQVWDLLAAFNKLLASIGRQRATHEVVYDDTPITLHATDVLDRLERDGPAMTFESIFEGRTLGEMIGLFLALLELIRQDRVRVDQPQPHGPIMVHLIDATPITSVMEPGDRMIKEDGLEREDVDAPEEEQEEFEEKPDRRLDGETLYEDELEDDDDEYRKAINAVEIGEVDLGRQENGETPSPPSQGDAGVGQSPADDDEPGGGDDDT